MLSADDGDTRARRVSTLSTARASDPVPIVEATMTAFAALVHDCRGAGLRPKVLDALIAATAIEQGLPVVTQDDDFDSMARVHSRLSVERV